MSFLSFTSLIAAGILAFAVQASAQPTGTFSPAGGIFGRAGDRPVHHGLDVTASVVQGYDTDTLSAPSGPGVNEALLSGSSTSFVGNLLYRWRGSRVQVGASGESVVRNYTQFPGAGGLSYSAGAGLSAKLDGRTTLIVNQTASYSPPYLYLLFPDGGVNHPGDAAPASPDYAITHTDSYLYGTTLTFARGLTTRSRLSATAELQYTQFPTDGTRNQHYQRLRGEYVKGLSTVVSLRTGYSYRTGEFWQGLDPAAARPGTSATEHVVTVGLDYSRRLSATRKIALGFTTGSTMVATAAATTATIQTGKAVQLTAEGSAEYEFSTRWLARGNYRRGLEYVAPLGEPVFADGFSAELVGLIHPRVEVMMSTRYSSGASALEWSALNYDTYGGEFVMRYALGRSWAIYGQYLYCFYDFRATSLHDLPSRFDRNGVRVGLTLWAPTLRR